VYAPVAKTRRTSTLLDGDLLDRVGRLARRTGRTKTAVISAALQAYVEVAEAEVPMLPFVAIGSSGHGSLSIDGKRLTVREMSERQR
jgi:hypothetical protein